MKRVLFWIGFILMIPFKGLSIFAEFLLNVPIIGIIAGVYKGYRIVIYIYDGSTNGFMIAVCIAAFIGGAVLTGVLVTFLCKILEYPLYGLTLYPAKLFDYCWHNIKISNDAGAYVNPNKTVKTTSMPKIFKPTLIKTKKQKKTELDKLPLNELLEWGRSPPVKYAKYIGR